MFILQNCRSWMISFCALWILGWTKEPNRSSSTALVLDLLADMIGSFDFGDLHALNSTALFYILLFSEGWKLECVCVNVFVCVCLLVLVSFRLVY